MAATSQQPPPDPETSTRAHMAITTTIKKGMNHLLRRVGARLETLTAERREQDRVRALEGSGYFDEAVFPLPPAFSSRFYEQLLADLPSHRNRFDTFDDPGRNDVRFSWNNGFFTSPDAEILYAMVRRFRPARILEIGCGNSTRVSRQAIIDGGLPTRLTCVDPEPRTDIQPFADEIHRRRVEATGDMQLFHSLAPGDFLFIDSSHEVRAGNDCVFLFLRALPELAPGVIVHVHDVFLPFDYPARYPETHAWAEHYLVQCLLAGRSEFEMLWSSYFLSRTLTGFASHFPRLRTHIPPTSLWLRRNA